jgi:hypothetical protein
MGDELKNEYIYLQNNGEYEDDTWCSESIHEDDIKYVRFDIYKKRIAELEEALRPLAKIAERVNDDANTRLWMMDCSIDSMPSIILTYADAHKAKQAIEKKQ